MPTKKRKADVFAGKGSIAGKLKQRRMARTRAMSASTLMGRKPAKKKATKKK